MSDIERVSEKENEGATASECEKEYEQDGVNVSEREALSPVRLNATDCRPSAPGPAT